jgi:hypothetical protein
LKNYDDETSTPTSRVRISDVQVVEPALEESSTSLTASKPIIGGVGISEEDVQELAGSDVAAASHGQSAGSEATRNGKVRKHVLRQNLSNNDTVTRRTPNANLSDSIAAKSRTGRKSKSTSVKSSTPNSTSVARRPNTNLGSESLSGFDGNNTVEMHKDQILKQQVREDYSHAVDTLQPGAFAVSGTTTGHDSINFSDEYPGSQSGLDQKVAAKGPVAVKNGTACDAFQVEATLVEPNDSPTPCDIEQNVRKQILDDAVEADIVDTSRIQKKIGCHVCIIITIVSLVVGLSIGLTARKKISDPKVIFVNHTDPPTLVPSNRPSQSPTAFSISLCSPWTYVEDESLYASTYSFILDMLPEEETHIIIENSTEICDPTRLAIFQLATQVGPDEVFSPLELARHPIDLGTRLSLGVFYFQMDGDNWDQSDRWLTNLNYCEWYGITCGFGTALTKIELVDNGLKGWLDADTKRRVSKIGRSFA